MYLSHWNFNQAPFANVPAGSMFYRSPQHEEALQRLRYVIESRRGVAMLTGEVGCGKTTVIKFLASRLNKDAVQLHMISNPALPPKQILQSILLKLGGKAANGASKALMLERLHQILSDRAATGHLTVLAIDEAHVIGNRQTLDELRMLLNFQTDDEFLVTLILLGQPPLLRNICELQPLKERIAIKFNLEPFDLSNTRGYVQFRLRHAGSTKNLFTQEAVEMLHAHTGGIPLRINNLCDRCLLIGVLQNVNVLDGRIVRDAIEDMVK